MPQDCSNWDFSLAPNRHQSTSLRSPPIVLPCPSFTSSFPSLPWCKITLSKWIFYSLWGHLGRLNSLQITFTSNRPTHHWVVQAERAAKPMAVSPGFYLRGQGEREGVPVWQFSPSPRVTGTESYRGGFWNGPGRPQICLAVGGHRGWFVSRRAVSWCAGQGTSLRSTFSPNGMWPIRRRRWWEISERGRDWERFILV